MIIDDGSTDNTEEEVVQDLLKDTEAGFKNRICKKKWRITYRLSGQQLN